MLVINSIRKAIKLYTFVLDLKDALKPILAIKYRAEYARYLRKHIRSRHTKILGAILLLNHAASTSTRRRLET